MQQHTQILTKEELARLRKEEVFNRSCKENAAIACNILREQLRNREMELRFKAEHTDIFFDYKKGVAYKEEAPPYQFSHPGQYKAFKEKKLSSLQTQ